MAKFWLINSITIAGVRQLPGDGVDDVTDNIAAYRSAGAQLWPQGTAVVDAAALQAQNAHRFRGANESELESIMRSAVDSVQLTDDGSEAWRAVSSWYVDPAAGDDANDGLTSTTALKTLRELTRRWGKNILPGVLSTVITPIQLVVVNILSSVPASDPLDADIELPSNTLLAFVGVPATTKSGTITGTTPQDPANNVAPSVADGVVFGAADVASRIRISSGANVGQMAWISKDLGAGTVRTSSWQSNSLPPPADNLILTGATQGTIVIGDPYVVESLPTLTIRKVQISSPLSGTGTRTTVGFANLTITGSPSSFPNTTHTPRNAVVATFKGCAFEGSHLCAYLFARPNYLNCRFKDNIVALAIHGVAVVRGGLSLGTVQVREGVPVIDGDFMIQGGGGFAALCFGPRVNSMAVFDSAVAGVSIGAEAPSGMASFNGFIGTHRIWGAGNATVGMLFGGGGIYSYQTNLPTITGTGGDFSMVGATNVYGIDAAGVPQTPFAPTWANVAAAQPAGGGGNAHFLANDCHIVKR